MKKDKLGLYSWIMRGKQRTQIIKILDSPQIPKQIAERTGLKFSNVSDVLQMMVKKKLVKCLNSHEKTGRIYQLTKKGLEIRRNLQTMHKQRF